MFASQKQTAAELLSKQRDQRSSIRPVCFGVSGKKHYACTCSRRDARHIAAGREKLAWEIIIEDEAGSRTTNDGNPQTTDVDMDSIVVVAGLKSWVARGVAFAASALIALQGPQMALAGVQKVGEFQGSGFIFKDSIQVMSIDDPKVSGVTIFVSDFQRSLTDRMSKDFFNEPSQASITCAQTSPLKIAGNISGKEGEEIFSETKNFLAFKTLHVRRIFDEKKNALVYVAYSTRFQSDNDKVSAGRFRTSICTVPLLSAVLQGDGTVGDGSLN